MVTKGYAFDVQFCDHEYCNCCRSKPFTLYSAHDAASGSWPNHYLDTQARVNQLLAENASIKAADGCGSKA